MSSGNNSTDTDYKPSNSFRQAFVFTKDERAWNYVKNDMLANKDISYALAVKIENEQIVTYIQLRRRKYFSKDFFSFSELKRCYGRSYECKARILSKATKDGIICTYGDFNPNLGGKPKQMNNFDEEISDEAKTLWEKEYSQGKVIRIKKIGGKWYVDFRRKKKNILTSRGTTYKLSLFLEIIKDIADAAEKIGFKAEKYKLTDINLA